MNRRRTEDLTADLLADMADTPGAAQQPTEQPARPPSPAPEHADEAPGPAFETTVVVSPLVWRPPRVRLEDAGWVGEFGPVRLQFRIR